jgi:hypothetical protein
MSTNRDEESLVIGKDIPWDAIINAFCRVKSFTSRAKVESGRIKDTTPGLYYAFLCIELPRIKDMPSEAFMPINHKLDFRNLWKIYKERGLSQDEEVLVVYSPTRQSKLGKILTGILPKLVIRIYPRGSLEKIYDWVNGKIDNAEMPKCLAEYDSRPENQFLK